VPIPGAAASTVTASFKETFPPTRHDRPGIDLPMTPQFGNRDMQCQVVRGSKGVTLPGKEGLWQEVSHGHYQRIEAKAIVKDDMLIDQHSKSVAPAIKSSVAEVREKAFPATYTEEDIREVHARYEQSMLPQKKNRTTWWSLPVWHRNLLRMILLLHQFLPCRHGSMAKY
jgi:hypothetical protein